MFDGMISAYCDNHTEDIDTKKRYSMLYQVVDLLTTAIKSFEININPLPLITLPEGSFTKGTHPIPT
jgi:hypothetical protein